MTDAARPDPLYVVSSYMSPTTAAMLRAAMIAGALFIAAMGFIFPMLTGEEDKLVTAVFFGVAVLDLVMAVMLPRFMASRPSPLRFEFHPDHLAIALGASTEKPLARVPYEDILRIEDFAGVPDKDRAAGLTGVVLYLRAARAELMRLPYYGTQDGPALTLKGLRSDENPLGRIKEVVEKSQPA